MELYRLIYASKHAGTTVETLDRILQASRANNVRDGITGALVIGEHHFLQLLEGDRKAIAQCLMRILRDRRHNSIQIICAGDSPHRLFYEWSMHRIETSRMKRQIIASYMINGELDPTRMSQKAIEDLCRTLSAGDWEAMAA